MSEIRIWSLGTHRSRRPVVRPNRWDDREARLEDLLTRASNRLQEVRPEMHDNPPGGTRIENIDDLTLVTRIAQELNRPRHADMDDRVRSPLIRWWRERRRSDP